jgi:hypothetical protein
MAINGKHTTELMIFPRVCRGVSGCSRERAHADVIDVYCVCVCYRSVGWSVGGEAGGFRVRASLPPNKDACSWSFERARDLRAAASCTLRYLSVYPFIGRRRMRRVKGGGFGGGTGKVEASAGEGGCRVLTFSQHR